MKNQYERLMRRCLNLAKKGEGKVSPNPLVGCVIFDDDYRIISEGYHIGYGKNHAEREAILNAKEDLKGKSLIVNLEPCSHYGKTPPCADLIIEKGIKRVITGMIDPNPVVKGKGIKKLKAAGIEVITGVLEDECLELNKFFINDIKNKRPYITIKTATTLDGKIAAKTYKSKWITDEASRKEAHKLRNRYDAILTSSSTVIKDNPSLTCRIKNGRNPIRIIVDTNLNTPSYSNVYNKDGTKVIVLISENIKDERIINYPENIQFIKCRIKGNHIDLKSALEKIYNTGIKSILIEAGGKLNKAFIEENLADNLIQFIAPKILGDKNGINFVYGYNRNEISECNNLIFRSTKKLKNDIILVSDFVKHEKQPLKRY